MKSLMNLQFTPVKKVRIGTAYYVLEYANVTDYVPFWREWRYVKRLEADCRTLNTKMPATSLASKIALSKSGSGQFLAYRLRPLQDGTADGSFALSYILRDRSGLLPYQVEPVTYLCNSILCNGAAIDGSDTGIGKTYHALAVARELRMIPAIICRISGISNWKVGCRHFGLNPLFIVNWERAKTKGFPYVQRLRDRMNHLHFRWQLPSNTLLIFDEAHMACNPASQNNRLWTASKGIRSISLSATFADRPARLQGLFTVLDITPASEFKKWLADFGNFSNQYDEIESLDAQGDMRRINRILYPRYGFRRAYTDPEVKKFFPDAVIQTEIVDLSLKKQQRQTRLYALMLRLVARYQQQGKQAGVLTAQTRYRQASELLKCDALADLAQTYIYEGKAVCIFVNYRESLFYLASRFHTQSLIYGDQHRDGISREKVINDFQSGASRIVISMVAAGGQSINLHDTLGRYQRVSLVCPAYNPIDIKQVLGRTRRAGSKSVPVIKLVYAAGGIEEKVARAVNEKIDNIEALNDGDLMEPDLFKMRMKNE